MFVGIESYMWSESQFLAAAATLRARGIDTMIVKIADGGQLWYGGYAGIDRVLKAIRSAGLDVLPFFFSYGDGFGYLAGEIAQANTLLNMGYNVCLDMETAWNGHADWARALVAGLHRPIWVSTWADPALQDWDAVLRALLPKVVAFLPQDYTTYLNGVWRQQYAAAGVPAPDIIPTLNKDTLAAAAGLDACTFWEYEQLSAADVEGAIARMANAVLTIEQASDHFEAIDATHWRRRDRPDIVLRDGLLAYYRSFGLAVYGIIGLPDENEHAILDAAGKVIPLTAMQRCERVAMAWDPKKQVDNPRGSGDCYHLHIDGTGPGADPRVAQLQALLVDAQKAAGSTTGLGSQCIDAVREIKAVVEKLAV